MESIIQTFNNEYEQKYVQAKIREEELRARIDEIVMQESKILQEKFAKQMAANEEMLIRLQIRKPVGLDPKSDELKEMRERSNNEFVQTVVNTMQMQVMSDVKIIIQEVERRVKAVPTAKFDPLYLEEGIDLLKKQIVARMDRSEANL